MFEKEAEEYFRDNAHNFDEVTACRECMEYGYNKANEEWKKHFLQCSSPFCLDNFSEVKCYGELGNMAKKESE
jgi:hypothetical protein